jgi:hypothetical protein
MSELQRYIGEHIRSAMETVMEENAAKVAQLLKDNPVLCEKCNTPKVPCDGCAWAYPDDSGCPISGFDPWVCPKELDHFKPAGILNQQ